MILECSEIAGACLMIYMRPMLKSIQKGGTS
jgi:hypothetical protein